MSSPSASPPVGASSISAPEPAAASASSTHPSVLPLFPSPPRSFKASSLVATPPSATPPNTPKILLKKVRATSSPPASASPTLPIHPLPRPTPLVGIAASGRTPYVLGALLEARKLGALTIGLSCVEGSPITKIVDLAITPVTGPEVITGSTRMKAGTATKLVLNMLSTGVMIRTGAIYGNLMVNVKPTNDKLIDRAIRIIMAASASVRPIDRPAATRLLIEAGSVKVAIAMQKLRISRPEAEERLAKVNGSLSKALRDNA